jgi:hypothetical protein
MKNNYSVIMTLTWAVTASPLAISQSTPSEFAEMSFFELFEQSIDDPQQGSQNESPWTFALQYKTVEFEGYLDGTDKLSYDQVLWEGPSETRTDKNFPVVPSVITQDVTAFALSYEINEDWRVHLSVPHIEQNTDHISIVPGYKEFSIRTSGIGDVVVTATQRLLSRPNSNWWLSMGISLPTGSIDEEGDTPRAPGNQQLPYTMQLGSGTYDIPLEVSYHSLGSRDWSTSFSANIRMGENDRGYRLGNNYSLSGRYRFHMLPTLHPFVGIDIQYSDSIHGADKSLLVDSPFPYPASITNPDLYGGTSIGARIGLNWTIADKYRLAGEFGKPLYQNLNGPQPKQDWYSSFQLSRIF